MATKRAPQRPTWSSPPTAELLVLERQIRESLDAGEQLKPFSYEGSTGKWSAWSSNLGDLIGRAFGPDSPQARSYQISTGFIADSPDRHRYGSAGDYERAMVEWRNGKITNKIESARGTLKAIAQELERRSAQPSAAGIARRDFSFMKAAPLRAIAERDHEELRAVADRTTKASALLAGSVIEGVLSDALQSAGFSASQVESMTFFELIDEAATAKIIQARTQKAAHAVRDVRNFVHPAVEIREGRLRQVDARAAIALMDMVLEDLL